MSASVNFAEIVAEAKQRDLASIVGQTVRLHRDGRLFAGCCPFHGEKTPSFFVYPKDQHYHCFGCGAHGDAIDFVMHSHRLSFREAASWLSGQQIGTFAPTDRAQPPADNQRNAELARKIWSEACLPKGTIVADYLHSRRLELPDEPVIRFHPECPNGKDKMPAMIALMSDPETGEPRGIHRTFLRPDGSAKSPR